MVRGTSSFLLTLKTDSLLQQQLSRYRAEHQTLVHFCMQGQVLACEEDLTHIHARTHTLRGLLMMGSKAEKEKEMSMKKRVMKIYHMIRKWHEKVVNTRSGMEHVGHDHIWVSV